MTNILAINSSAQVEGSVTRELVANFIEKLGTKQSVSVTDRDLAKETLPFVSAEWIGANFTDEAERNETQKEALAKSDALIEELENNDIVLIGLPIYNFGVPAALKAWVDMVARARKTFRYTENGPEGLLTGKKAVVFVASGGTQADSDIDFATPYIRHALGFIGIKDVTVVKADQAMFRGDEPRQEALKATDELVASL